VVGFTRAGRGLFCSGKSQRNLLQFGHFSTSHFRRFRLPPQRYRRDYSLCVPKRQNETAHARPGPKGRRRPGWCMKRMRKPQRVNGAYTRLPMRSRARVRRLLRLGLSRMARLRCVMRWYLVSTRFTARGSPRPGPLRTVSAEMDFVRVKRLLTDDREQVFRLGKTALRPEALTAPVRHDGNDSLTHPGSMNLSHASVQERGARTRVGLRSLGR
jgi:hypothetical protein